MYSTVDTGFSYNLAKETQTDNRKWCNRTKKLNKPPFYFWYTVWFVQRSQWMSRTGLLLSPTSLDFQWSEKKANKIKQISTTFSNNILWYERHHTNNCYLLKLFFPWKKNKSTNIHKSTASGCQWSSVLTLKFCYQTMPIMRKTAQKQQKCLDFCSSKNRWANKSNNNNYKDHPHLHKGI